MLTGCIDFLLDKLCSDPEDVISLTLVVIAFMRSQHRPGESGHSKLGHCKLSHGP